MHCNEGACNDEGATNLQNVVMVLSNLAFLLPIYTAWRKRFPVIGAWVFWTMVASTLHHLCIGQLWCALGFSCHDLRRLDHLFAFGSVVKTALFLMQFTDVYAMAAHSDTGGGGTVSGSQVARRLWLWKIVDDGLLLLVAVLVINNPTASRNPVVVTVALVAVAVVKWAVIDRFHVTWSHYNWPWLVAAAVVATAGIVFFFLDGHVAYWWSHSIWHVLIALGLDFLLRAHSPYFVDPVATQLHDAALPAAAEATAPNGSAASKLPNGTAAAATPTSMRLLLPPHVDELFQDHTTHAAYQPHNYHNLVEGVNSKVWARRQ